MSGWNELGAALGSMQGTQQASYGRGIDQGARQASLLEQARERRDKNIAMAAITPQAIGNIDIDPVTGQRNDPEARNALQASLVSSMFRAGVDPRQFSGYQKDQQGINFRDRAMQEAVSPTHDDNLMNRVLGVIGGKPMQLTKIEGQNIINPMATPDSQHIETTQRGLADIMRVGAQANASNAQAGASRARANLTNVQAAAGGFNPNTGGRSTGGAALPLMPPRDPNAPTGSAALAQVDPNIRDIVSAVVDGRYPIPTGRASTSPEWQAVVHAATQVDPTFEASNYPARAAARKNALQGKWAQQSISLNTLAGHLKEAYDASEALGNRSSPTWNNIANSALSGMGDPAQNNFDRAANTAGSEFATLLKGGVPSVSEIDEQRHTLNSNQSPEQLRGALGTMAAQVQARLQALQEAQHQALGVGAKNIKVIMPSSEKAFLDILGKGHLPGDPGRSDPGSLGEAMGTPSTSAPHAGAYAPGQVITVSGKQYRVTGGDPADPDLEAL